MNRYSLKLKIRNTDEMYENYFEERGVNTINHYDTPIFEYPSTSELNGINTIEHIWTYGDRYFKLASKYYGDPKMWWVIAMFNKKTT